MKRLVITIPDHLDARLAVQARHRRTSKSAVVREAVEAALRMSAKPHRGSVLDLVRDLVGCVAGPGDLSVNKAHFKDFGR